MMSTMQIVENVGAFLLYSVFVYLFATLLSHNRIHSKGKFGISRVPKPLQFWIRPRILFQENIEREHARFLGIVYHSMFSLLAVFVFPVFLVLLFINPNLALQIKDILFSFALAVGVIFMIIILPFEVVNLIIDHFHNQKK